MNWFKHDTDATTDAKLKKLIIRYGAIGYAVYFHCLELIASEISESNITFELEHDAEIIADDLRIRGDSNKSGMEIVEEIMRYMIELNLFEESNGHIFCFKLLKRLDNSMTSNPKLRALISSAKQNHDDVMTNHDKIMTNHDSVMTNLDFIMLDKNRKDKNRKDIYIPENAENSEKSTSDNEQDITKSVNSKKSESKKTKQFIPPTLEEIQSYISEKKYSVNAKVFFEYYSATNWCDISGKKIQSWKGKIVRWNSRDNKNNSYDKRLPKSDQFSQAESDEEVIF